MKKTTFLRLIIIISLSISTISVSAQHLYLHDADGKVLYLGKDNVDSITFSNYDTDSVYHDAIVSQVVHTRYEKIHIPISSIEGISCVAQDVSYSTCPDGNHPHMIDLGLPSGTKWACCNVGASSPEGYGGYYAWGETSEKQVYNEVTYQYATGQDNNGDGKYDDYDSDTGLYGVWQNIGSDIAGTSYDVAHVKWGGSWRMPSVEQIQELLDNCTSKWTHVNGVYGREFTGPNGGMVFLPAAGHRWGDGLYDEGDYGYSWSSTQNPDGIYTRYASTLFFRSVYAYWGDSGYRSYGRSVRPVSK